ncbi:hypothetical protein [Arthrobacter oryzae]|nr:hypothetical protein [Arthrobacter oryzae]WLQ05035.1 hypothetical protein Q8Z05_12835 [Arthrobacter oryzae]
MSSATSTTLSAFLHLLRLTVPLRYGVAGWGTMHVLADAYKG